MKVFLVNLIMAIIDIVAFMILPYATIATVMITIIAYTISFDQGVFKAAFAMVLQFVVGLALVWVAVTALGVAVPSLG